MLKKEKKEQTQNTSTGLYSNSLKSEMKPISKKAAHRAAFFDIRIHFLTIPLLQQPSQQSS